jgi:[acyl-carrier-protein] S-malonyltransferase
VTLASVACLFPGQGSQVVGMGRDLCEAFPVAAATFEEADDSLGASLGRLCFDGPPEALSLTEHAQPAILTASVAAFRVLHGSTGLEPAVLAGHSLGEWSALVVSGAIAFADAVRGVRERGRLMQRAVPAGVGAMAAVMGLESDDVGVLCAIAAEDDVLGPANLNGAGQTVVAGGVAAVERLVALAASRGGKARRLPVSAPFHCALMAPAADGLAAWLADTTLHAPAWPIVTSVEARQVTGVDDVRRLLVAQVTAPVRWQETMHAVAAHDVGLALEVGPGRVLAGLLRREVPALRCLGVSGPADVEAVRQALERDAEPAVGASR